jgi:hypothetical protein
MNRRIGRRRAMASLGAGSLALAVAGPGDIASLSSRTAAAPVATWLRSMIADLESARRVGQLYLQTAPEDADRDRLLADLFPRLEPQAGDRRDSFAACCRQDFADGATVRVDGWVLSRTEARLCALAALV